MKILKTKLPGCYEIHPDIFFDPRGKFVKTFHEDTFAEHGLSTHFSEEYYTLSQQRVLRGLHFQTPPHDHAKVVYCVTGKVLDVVVDIRIGSSSFGEYSLVELNADKSNMIYIPSGMAHGFYVLSGTARMIYNVTSVHAPTHDTGILWDSVGIPWPDSSPLISERDKSFPRFQGFESPFVFSNLSHSI